MSEALSHIDSAPRILTDGDRVETRRTPDNPADMKPHESKRPEAAATAGDGEEPADYQEELPRVEPEQAAGNTAQLRQERTLRGTGYSPVAKQPRVIIEHLKTIPTSPEIGNPAKPRSDSRTPWRPPKARQSTQLRKEANLQNDSASIAPVQPIDRRSAQMEQSSSAIETIRKPLESGNALHDSSSSRVLCNPTPVMDRKLEGPRLSIGRLEIQIVQENAPPPKSRQTRAKQDWGDAWEDLDRQHIRRLGAV